MIRLRLALAVAAALLFNQSLTLAAQEDPRLARGREYLQLLIDGKYEDFCAKGDEMMTAGFRPSRAQLTWQTLISRLGPFQKEQSAELSANGENATIKFVWRFERGAATGRLILDKGDRIAGLWFDRMDLLVPPPKYADPEKFTEKEVKVSAGRFELNGKLTLPKDAEKPPVAILLHGSGPQDMDQSIGGVQMFRDLAWGLASKEIAVLRFDKRTRAHPLATQPADWTLETESIEDARAAIKLLRARDDVDPRKIFVVGHSLGAMAAPYVAREEQDLAGLVLICAAGRPILDLVEEQVAYVAEVDGAVDPNEIRQLQTIREQLQIIRGGNAASMPGLLLGQPGIYWSRMNELAPWEVAGRLNCPILILHGGRDYQVGRVDAETWKKFASDHKDAKHRYYDKLNHLLVAGEGPSSPNEYGQTANVDEELVRDLAEWIRTTAKSAGGGTQK